MICLSCELLRFPYRRLIANWTLEEVFVRFAWLAIPLEYFIVTRFSGGIAKEHGVATVLIALLTLLAVLCVSLMLSAVPLPVSASYGDRVRIWTVSLVLNWSIALFLLALGYVASMGHCYNYDFLACMIYHSLDQWFFALDDYPYLLDPATFIVYLCYALAAVLVIKAVAWCFGSEPNKPMPPGPNVLVIAGLTGFIMMILHGYTKIP
jgi:hypothetical protein